jgi:hypothetical protein
MQAAIFLAWKCAARVDEICRLMGKSFLQLKENEIVVEWLDRTKSTSATPFTTRAWTVVHHQAPMSEILDILRRLHPEELLLDLSTDQVVDWIRRDAELALLSAHSLKRGAMGVLTMMVVDRQLDIELLARVAKHKTDHEVLSPSTLRYPPDRVAVAKMLRTQEATVLLPCLPYATPPPNNALPPLPPELLNPATNRLPQQRAGRPQSSIAARVQERRQSQHQRTQSAPL